MRTYNHRRAESADNIRYFARRNSRGYMMRSEKRNGYNYGGSSFGSQPPKRKRKRAGFFYSFFTLLLSLLLWPVGMIMLWKRKLRWSIGSKLLTSIITLFLVFVAFSLLRIFWKPLVEGIAAILS